MKTRLRIRDTVPGEVGQAIPLLDDKRATGWTCAVVPREDPRLPIRVCDEAAETFKILHPDLPFEMAGTHADLDEQVNRMKARLLAGKGNTP